jgi:Uma2 family endonuclease
MVQAPGARRFTVKDYYRMARAGILGPDDRVELIEGEIVEMPPISDRHAVSVNLLNRIFVQGTGPEITIQVQGPIRLSAYSEPVPDLAVLKGPPDTYLGGHPGPEAVLLLVEVSLSTLSYDRRRKLPLYARSGVPEVWIVNLRDGRVEQNSQPVDGSYQQTRILGADEVIGPLYIPRIEVKVSDILV